MAARWVSSSSLPESNWLNSVSILSSSRLKAWNSSSIIKKRPRSSVWSFLVDSAWRSNSMRSFSRALSFSLIRVVSWSRFACWICKDWCCCSASWSASSFSTKKFSRSLRFSLNFMRSSTSKDRRSWANSFRSRICTTRFFVLSWSLMTKLTSRLRMSSKRSLYFSASSASAWRGNNCCSNSSKISWTRSRFCSVRSSLRPASSFFDLIFAIPTASSKTARRSLESLLKIWSIFPWLIMEYPLTPSPVSNMMSRMSLRRTDLRLIAYTLSPERYSLRVSATSE